MRGSAREKGAEVFHRALYVHGISLWYDKSMKNEKTKERAKKLRREGKTFQEINHLLNTNIPKSTFSTWFAGIAIPWGIVQKMEKERKKTLQKAQKKAVLAGERKREKYYNELLFRNRDLEKLCDKREVGRVVLAALYLCEGTKNKRSSMVFGNSDPHIIKLFLRLFREIFIVDEKKFRCTLQGRSDQDIQQLESFWSSVTGISLDQFYKARIDPRTKGKVLKKPEYKGVCRIDYLSAGVFHEIMAMCEIVVGSAK
jgi:hypothetical protein